MIFHYFYKGKEETIDTWNFPSGFGFLGAYAEEHIVGFAIIREEDNGKIGVYGIDDKGKFNQGQEDVLDWIDENVSWLVRDNLMLDEQSAAVELIPTEDYEFDPNNAATYIPNAFIKSCRVIKEVQPDGGGGGGDGDGDDSGGGDGYQPHYRVLYYRDEYSGNTMDALNPYTEDGLGNLHNYAYTAAGRYIYKNNIRSFGDVDITHTYLYAGGKKFGFDWQSGERSGGSLKEALDADEWMDGLEGSLDGEPYAIKKTEVRYGFRITVNDEMLVNDTSEWDGFLLRMEASIAT